MNTVRLIAQSTVQYLKRASMRRHLMSFNDVMLDDIGVSRELLEQGVKAYPWLMKLNKNVAMPHIKIVVSQNHYDKVSGIKTAANNFKQDAKGFAKAA